MYTHYELCQAIDVEYINSLIPDPWANHLVIDDIELGSNLGAFVIDHNGNVKETLMLIKDARQRRVDLQTSSLDLIIVRMRKRGMLPFESSPVQGSSRIVCIACPDRIY